MGRTSDADQVAYFDFAYGEHDKANQLWRDLLARNNAEIVLSLVRRMELRVNRVLDVGCGDAALLAELSRRGLGRSCVAYEISAPIVEFVKRPWDTHARPSNVPTDTRSPGATIV